MFLQKDEIAPAYINLKDPRYVEIDNMLYSGIIIVNYYREYSELILKKIIESNLNMNISIFYEKQDPYKTIKNLTYHIANTGVEAKENKQDYDIAAFTNNDAKYIRREIQVNNEDIYYLYIYLDVFSANKQEQEYLLNKIEGILQSNGIQTRRANFREEQIFLSCMPIMQNNNSLKSASRRNVLTSGLIATYPFISSSIFDEEGIFCGTNIYNNSLVFIDRFNSEKYKNANICIFGTSGARQILFYKAYDFKVQAFRLRTIRDRSRKRI